MQAWLRPSTTSAQTVMQRHASRHLRQNCVSCADRAVLPAVVLWRAVRAGLGGQRPRQQRRRRMATVAQHRALRLGAAAVLVQQEEERVSVRGWQGVVLSRWHHTGGRRPPHAPMRAVAVASTHRHRWQQLRTRGNARLQSTWRKEARISCHIYPVAGTRLPAPRRPWSSRLSFPLPTFRRRGSPVQAYLDFRFSSFCGVT